MKIAYADKSGITVYGSDATHFFYVHVAKKADPHANNIFLVDGAERVAVATKTTEAGR